MSIHLPLAKAKTRAHKNSSFDNHSRRFFSNHKKLALEPLEDRRMLSFGPALLLDGVDDYATAADSASLDLGIGATEDFTIEAQFDVPDLNVEGRQAIIYKEGAYSLYADFHASQPDQISFQVWQGGNAYTVSAAASDLAVGWHHVAAVFDNEWTPTQDQLAIYLDGLRVGVANNTDFSPGIDNSSAALSIGSQGGACPFHGGIDEVRLSNVTRYSGTTYSLPISAFTSNSSTRALWHFDETSGTTSFADASINANLLMGLNGAHTENTSPTPSAPDLLSISDSGVSATDNLTNLDNSQPENALQFSVSNCLAGATVTVYANGIAIGSAVATGSTTTITTNGKVDLTDGQHLISARQTVTGQMESSDSAALAVTIDTTIPSNFLLGGYDTSGLAFGVVVTGTLAYVADRSAGLQNIDISNPSSPVRVGGYDTSGSAYGVAISGTLALVADGTAGLQIIDVSNPAAPIRLGGYDTSGTAYGVAISGTLAFVADGTAGLQIIDVSNPAAPIRMGGYDTSGTASGVLVSGTRAYVADGSSGLQVINVSNPAAPVRLGGYDTSGFANGVALEESLIYVADEDSGIQIIDVSNPVLPVRLGGYDTSGSAYGVALSGNFAYVADYSSGLQVIDISNPASPLWYGGYSTTGTAMGVTASGTTAFLATNSGGLQIINLFTPASPDLITDSGISSTDNITLANGPLFNVSVPGNSYFRFYCNDVQSGSDYLTGTSYLMPTQTDGTYNYTVAIVDAAGNRSAPSSPLAVTIDTQKPVAEMMPVTPSLRNTDLSTIDIVFSEPIALSTFTYEDLTLTRDGSIVTLSNAVTVSRLSGTTYRIGGLSNFTTSDGIYVLSVNTSGIVDIAGNAGSGIPSDTWVKNIGIPTDIFLSSTTVAENLPSGIVVGILSTSDPSADDTFSYSLAGGWGGDDNGLFTITGNILRTNALFDYESKANCSVRIRTTDASGFWYEKPFSIRVDDQPEVIVIGASNWTDSGLTCALGGDGKLHFYNTGTMTDAIPPHDPAKVIGVSIVGRNINDSVIDNYCGIFSNLLIDHATFIFNQDNALSAGTLVTVDGGVLNFNGHFTDISDLTLVNDGQANVTNIKNSSTTVTSGTLTANSIDCDSLNITLLDKSAPRDYTITTDESIIKATESVNTSFTIVSAEVGAVYRYIVSSSGGAGSVTGEGTITSATQQITGIDVSSLPEGMLIYSVILTDAAGNAGIPAIAAATLDKNAPVGYSITANNSNIGATEAANTGFTFAGAEIGATYICSVTSSGGVGAVFKSGTISWVNKQITGINVSSLPEGMLTFSITVIDAAGNAGATATATATLDKSAPAGYTVMANDSHIGSAQAPNTGFTFAGAEVGTSYNYTVTSSGGLGTITGTGTVTSATQQITGINVSSLPNGTLTFIVRLTDLSENVGPAANATAILDKPAPLGYTIAASDTLINGTESLNTGFTFAGAEIGTTYKYTVTSSGGTGSVTGTGTITSAILQITGINVSSLANGMLTYSVTLTDAAGHVGSAATATATLDKSAPTGYLVTANDTLINGTEALNTGFNFTGAEVGATYIYTVTSSGGGSSVTGTGTITSATQQITGINVSSLANGMITYSVMLTDPAGNVGSSATTVATLDKTAPTGYSITADDSNIGNAEATNTSFTFTGAEVGATYICTVTSSGGMGTVTKSGTISLATQQITGINISSLPDGILTFSVKLTDPAGNVGNPATATATLDKTAPAGYSITASDSNISKAEATNTSFTFTGAEVGANYNYTVTSSGGGGSVTGTGTITSAVQQITGINVSSLPNGTLTFSVRLTDMAGNAGAAATAMATLDKSIPAGYTITPNDTLLNEAESVNTGFIFANAEIGATYNYTISSSGGVGLVTGTGTITSATQQITGIDVSSLPDGTLTYSVMLTDIAGNVGNPATATATLDKTAPTGYSIFADDSNIGTAKAENASFTFTDAEVGTTYNYTVTSSDGLGTITGTGTVTSATQQITGINVSSLPNGTLTYSVMLTDMAGNVGIAVTATAILDKTANANSMISPAVNVYLSMPWRFDNQPTIAFASRSPMTVQLRASFNENLSDCLTQTKMQTSSTLNTNQILHSLALQSLVRDYQLNFAIEQLDSDLLVSKHFHKQDKLAKKAVDDFHADLVGAIE